MNQKYLAWGLATCVFVLFLLDISELGSDETAKNTTINTKSKTQQDPMQKKEAYVSIMYGGTPRDYEYFLGARVMWQSLRESNTTRDMITLVTPNVRQSYRSILEAEGSIVQEVPPLVNPYKNQDKYNDRFKFALIKLLAWNMTQYERIVLMDADVLVLNNMDELFTCGNFCAVYINPCIFHTGVIVLEPDREVFGDMVVKLREHLDSYDGADQGFMNSYFEGVLDAPLFTDERSSQSLKKRERLTGYWRLPFGYHLDSVYWYQRFRWEVPCSSIKAMGFPGLPPMKPWFWYSYPLMDLTAFWNSYRDRLPPQHTEIMVTKTSLLVALVPIPILLIVFIILNYYSNIIYPIEDKLWGIIERVASLLLWANNRTLRSSATTDLRIQTEAEEVNFLLISPAIGLTAQLFGMYVGFKLIPSTVHPIPGWLLLFEYMAIFTATTYASYFQSIARHYGASRLAYNPIATYPDIKGLMVWVGVWFLVPWLYGYILSAQVFELITQKIVFAVVGMVGIFCIWIYCYFQITLLYRNQLRLHLNAQLIYVK